MSCSGYTDLFSRLISIGKNLRKVNYKTKQKLKSK